MSDEYCRTYVEPMKMLRGNLSTCARTPFICFIFISMRHGTCSCSAPVQLQLRLVGFCLCSGPAALWALTCQCRAVGYGAADPATSPVSARSSPCQLSRRATLHGAAMEVAKSSSIGSSEASRPAGVPRGHRITLRDTVALPSVRGTRQRPKDTRQMLCRV